MATLHQFVMIAMTSTINQVQLWFFITLLVRILLRIIQVSRRTTSILAMDRITLVQGRTMLLLALLIWNRCTTVDNYQNPPSAILIRVLLSMLLENLRISNKLSLLKALTSSLAMVCLLLPQDLLLLFLPIIPMCLCSLSLNHLLHVSCITKNLISVSKFSRDNGVYFEFHSNYYATKSHVTNEVLLQGNIGHDGLYSFSNI